MEKASENKFRIRLVTQPGLNSVRISTHIYNSFEEMGQLAYFIKNV